MSPGIRTVTASTRSFGGLPAPAHAWLVGMFLLFLGERLFGGESTARWVLDGVGLLLLVASFGLRASAHNAALPDQKPIHLRGILFGLLGLSSLVVYALGTNEFVNQLGFADEETELRYETVISALWPILWLVGTLPMLAVDRVLAANPVRVMPARAREATLGALGLAFALAMLFPLNYLGAELNKRWDFGYFKTARPGTSTLNMVQGLEEPITAFLFFPTSSDVTEELRTYFSEIDEAGGDTFEVQYVDHALEPELAKELRIQGNGTIALVRGEGEEQQVERISIGDDFDKARRKLKSLDEDFNKTLLKLARGKRVAYFTAGHGELDWSSDRDILHKTSNLRKLLQAMNYQVKPLSLAEGLGMEVPEDASVVAILGPQTDFLPEELAALDAYRRKGGSLLVALEPGGPDMAALLDPIGAAFDPGATLASDTSYIPVTRKPADRVNLFTNKYSTHPSVTTLSRNQDQMVLILPGAGVLTEKPGGGKTTVTIRSLGDIWADRNSNYELDATNEDGALFANVGQEPEKRDTFLFALAGTGPVEGGAEAAEDAPQEYRAIVMADATWASDGPLQLDVNRANFQYVIDAFSWLGHDESSQGTIESEEDVRIEHAKDKQGWIFYGTGFIVPLGFLGLGLGRLGYRRRRGGA